MGLQTRRGLERRQRRGLRRLLDERMPRAAHYGRPYARLADVPIVDKATVLGDFAGFNVHGIDLDTALASARTAEHSRDFRSTLPGGVTVGLSSGTSGRPGVFLVDDAERMRWAGTVLGRLLDRRSLARLVQPWHPPLRIAFCLRANSNLYESVASRRIAFRFVDLVAPFDAVVAEVAAARPDVLVAPSSVLAELARAAGRGELAVAPRLVVAVAEVLDPADADLVESAWGVRPRRVYQATEGLLALDCRHGRLHLNEQGVVIESEWLDAERRRFVPIVTDFDRSTQLVVRYRLDDVLRLPAAEEPCPCGNPARVVEAVEGRADEVVVAVGADGRSVPVFPDTLRRAMALALSAEGAGRRRGAGWGIRWSLGSQGSPGSPESPDPPDAPDPPGSALSPTSPASLEVALERTGDAEADRATEVAVRRALEELFDSVGALRPAMRFVAWASPAPGAKAVRIRRAGPALAVATPLEEARDGR